MKTGVLNWSGPSRGCSKPNPTMFMRNDMDEDGIVTAGLFGRFVDTLNIAWDIAFVIWSAGWRGWSKPGMESRTSRCEAWSRWFVCVYRSTNTRLSTLICEEVCFLPSSQLYGCTNGGSFWERYVGVICRGCHGGRRGCRKEGDRAWVKHHIEFIPTVTDVNITYTLSLIKTRRVSTREGYLRINT